MFTIVADKQFSRSKCKRFVSDIMDVHMGNISREDVLKLARLCRFDLSESELDRLSVELPKILEYVAQLQAVDVSGLEPTDQVTGLTNATRPDEVREYQAKPRDLLAGVPATEKNMIKVKRMIV